MFRLFNFTRRARRMVLQPDEKAAMRTALSVHARANPVRDDVPARQTMASHIFMKPMPIAFALLAALLLSGGTAYAAENTVPGDVLYPVKVGVTENLRAAVATSAVAKTEWKAEQVERRLEEAERLIADKRWDALSAEEREALEARLQKLADAARTRVATLSTTDAAAAIDAGTRLEAALRAHENIIDRIEGNENLSAEAKTRLTVIVGRQIEHLEDVRGKIEERQDRTDEKGDKAAESLARIALDAIEKAKKRLASDDVELSADERTDLNAQVKIAQDLYSEGQALLAKDDVVGAMAKFRQSHRVSLEAMTYLRLATEGSHLDLKIDASTVLRGDKNRGHGNDADRIDDDNRNAEKHEDRLDHQEDRREDRDENRNDDGRRGGLLNIRLGN